MKEREDSSQCKMFTKSMRHFLRILRMYLPWTAITKICLFSIHEVCLCSATGPFISDLKAELIM